MKQKLSAGLIAAMLTTPLSAQNLDITIVNLTHGSHFTPLFTAAHNGDSHLFQVGTVASTNLQAMAEGGDISGLASDSDAGGADKSENPAAGLLAPGSSTNFTMDTQVQNTHFSMVAMILPSNDGFVGLDSLEIPTAPGTYTYNLNAYDAGTEANDEIINGGGAPGVAGIPEDPLAMNGVNAMGVTDTEGNSHVHIHRGVLGDSDSSGGASDLDSRVHRWLNPVARLTIEVK